MSEAARGLGRRGLLTGLAAVLTAASFLWYSVQLRPAAIRTPHAFTEDAVQGSTEEPTRQPTPAELMRQIESARQAIAGQIGQPPFTGPISSQPTFVSDLEWHVFQGVAQTHADPSRELTLLVNRLRFTRLESFWHSLQARGADTDLRHRLAEQLLYEIPGRVEAQQLDLAQAQALQLQLLEDLVGDPLARAQRASEESMRLSRDSASPKPL